MNTGRLARLFNVVLGLWLFISTFVWPHTMPQAANAALVGLFIALTALSAWSTRPPRKLRFANVALALWLLVSIAAFPTRVTATKINSGVVGVLVLALALVPPTRRSAPLRPT
jgi:hypothetical protein